MISGEPVDGDMPDPEGDPPATPPAFLAPVPDPLVPDDDVLAPIRAICATASFSLRMAGASVSVALPVGHRGRITATNERAAWLDEIQFGLGEGPSIEAFGEGHPVVVGDVTDENTAPWPAFAREVQGTPVVGVVALPLQIGAIRLGTLTLYRNSPVSLSDDDLAQALRLADLVASCLLDLVGPDSVPGSNHTDASAIAHEWGTDLYRVEVNQATGMLAVRLGVPIELALARIRAHAFVSDTTVADVARAIIAGTLRLER